MELWIRTHSEESKLGLMTGSFERRDIFLWRNKTRLRRNEITELKVNVWKDFYFLCSFGTDNWKLAHNKLRFPSLKTAVHIHPSGTKRCVHALSTDWIFKSPESLLILWFHDLMKMGTGAICPGENSQAERKSPREIRQPSLLLSLSLCT